MTVAEMHKYVLQKLDSIQGEWKFASEDVERAINQAIDNFVSTRFDKSLNQQQKGFEMSVTRMSDLNNLIVDQDSIPVYLKSTSFTNNLVVEYMPLPADFRYVVKAHASICYNRNGVEYTVQAGPPSYREPSGAEGTTFSRKKVPARLAQITDLHALSGDPFNKTRIDSVKYTVNDSSLFFYTNGQFLIEDAGLTYIKNPVKVSVEEGIDCDLPESTHEEIVNLAANLLIQTRTYRQTSGESE